MSGEGSYADSSPHLAYLIGTRWKRKPPGREVVDVRRAWFWGSNPDDPVVRAHPVGGGRPVVMGVATLHKDYEPLRASLSGDDGDRKPR